MRSTPSLPAAHGNNLGSHPRFPPISRSFKTVLQQRKNAPMICSGGTVSRRGRLRAPGLMLMPLAGSLLQLTPNIDIIGDASFFEAGRIKQWQQNAVQGAMAVPRAF